MVERPSIRQHPDKHQKCSEICPESNEHWRNPFSQDNLQLFMQINYILTKLGETGSHQFPTYYHQIHSIVSMCPASVSKTKRNTSISPSHTHTNMQEKPFSLQNLRCLSCGHEMDKYWLLIKIRWWALHWEANSTPKHHKNNNPNVCFLSLTGTPNMERNDSKCPFASLFPTTSDQQALLLVISLHLSPSKGPSA